MLGKNLTPSHFHTGSIKVCSITHILLHVITEITPSCVVFFIHSILKFCGDKTLFEEIEI